MTERLRRSLFGGDMSGRAVDRARDFWLDPPNDPEPCPICEAEDECGCFEPDYEQMLTDRRDGWL